MKYVCEKCGRIFNDNSADKKEFVESEEIWGAQYTWSSTSYYCPECGNSHFNEYYGELQDGDNIKYEEEQNEADY